MTDLVLINNQEVSFEVVGDQTFTTSLDVASVFGKRHDNIIAQIRNFPKDEFGVLNFKETYKDTELRGFAGKFGVTRKDPYYLITKDGFCLLVMGFTGEKAYKFKVEFIKAFNRMQNLIKTGRINTAHTLISGVGDEQNKQKNADMTSRFLELQSRYISAIERENENLRSFVSLDKAPKVRHDTPKTGKGIAFGQMELNKARELFYKGMNFSDIAKVLNRTPRTISRNLKKAGVR